MIRSTKKMIIMSKPYDVIHRFLDSNVDGSEFLDMALSRFLDNETVANAEFVYEQFTEIFRYTDAAGNPILDLMDMMRDYEANAAAFTESQRDHFVHSVNVFILGLYLYSVNDTIRSAFSEHFGKIVFSRDDECFLFLWGNTALFHDVGYPLEIALNQAKRFTRSVGAIFGKNARTKISLEVHPLSDVTQLDLGEWNMGVRDSIELIGEYTAKCLGTDIDVRGTIENYPQYMSDSCFVDHGFFSAMILVRTYASTLQMSGQPIDLFLRGIVPTSSAILMHNMYPHTFIERKGMPPLKITSHPLAFLLILCDELQEWNRKGYGINPSQTFWPSNSLYIYENGRFRMNYCVDWGEYGQEFAEEKMQSIGKYLDLSTPFPNGISISCSSNNSATYFREQLEGKFGECLPRPLQSKIMEIAKAIHDSYIRERLKESPDAILEYPDWDSLPQDLVYSNMNQAVGITRTLDRAGYRIGDPSEGVDGFPPSEVEFMAILEHDRWVEERTGNGWVYGPKKDVEHRISPYLVPWDDLSEEIRELDRQAVRNIVGIFRDAGMGIVRK